MRISLLIVFISFSLCATAQEKPYYYQIPDTPTTYTPNLVAARLVDGVGFRYYWATEGLRPDDLSFKPSPEARSSFETLQHIYFLTRTLLNAVKGEATTPAPREDLSFAELRQRTLNNIREASDRLKKADAHLENMDMVFRQGDRETRFPFWNLLNGPIADALWHIGQVVSFRRSSGNPLPQGVDVLSGIKQQGD